MNVSKILLSSTLILISAPAMAQMIGPLSKDPAAQPNGIYKIDPKHTSVTWKVWHMGTSHYTSRFSKVDGELSYDPKDLTKSSVKITIDPASVDTGLPDFNKEIAGEKFLGGDKHPAITFDSTAVTKTGATTGTVTGNLSINGVTKPVTLDVTFNGGLDNNIMGAHDIGFSAKGKINRSDFGVNYGIPMVSDEVTIDIETEFLQKAAHAAMPAAAAPAKK